jgi:hypothetical protein
VIALLLNSQLLEPAERSRYPLGIMMSRLVQIERHSDFDESVWYGYIMFETESLMVLQYVSDSYNLDGYRCVRKSDISCVKDEFSRKDFVQRALRCKGVTCSAPKIEMADDLRKMMERIPVVYGLVTIHRELVCPNECEIGVLRDTSSDTYNLEWITPNGDWIHDDRPFRFTDVTRLDWGDEYSRTLLIVNADRNGG